MSVDTHGSNRDPNPSGLLDALVDAERASMHPPEDAQAATWERVVGTVAMGAPPPVEPTSVAAPTAASAAPWLKIVLGVLLGGAVAAIGYSVTAEPEDPAPTAAVQSDAAEDPASPEPPAAPAAAESPAEPPAVMVAPAVKPPPDPPPATVQQPAKKARAAPSKGTTPPASDLAEETRLLARARARLRAGSPNDALAPLAEHQTRFPDGQLTEDRMVLRAQALCEAGDRPSGRKAAAALRKAFPASSHLPRVDRTCK